MDGIRVEQENNDALLSKFMDDMLPTKLFCRSPTSKDQLWVFWSQDASKHTSPNWGIHERIKTALCDKFHLIWGNALVQFWATEMIGGRLHLTTSLQPFALKYLTNEKLNQYRRHCVGNKLVVADVEGEEEDLMDGILGRVFRNQLPEFGPELVYYSLSEYPQRDFALSCGIQSTMALPVLEPSGLGCIGVLELLFLRDDYSLHWPVQSVNLALKRAYLRTIDTTIIHDHISDVYKGSIQKEIKAALKQVCNTYYLSHAITWVSCAHIICDRSCNNSRVSFQGELLVTSPGMSFFSNNRKPGAYFTSLRVRQGLVGKAFSSRNSYFCRDVCQLSISEYPLVHFARKSRLGASFAVCLRTISTGNHEFVIEFIFPSNKTCTEDLHVLFSSILKTMNEQLKSFEVVTGDTENEIFTEVNKYGGSFVKASLGKGKRVIYKEQSNSTFTSFKTISISEEEEGATTEDSLPRLRSTESTFNSTWGKPVWPSCKRSKCVNESDQVILESSFSDNRSAQIADLGRAFKDLHSKVILKKSESNDFGNSKTASTSCLKLFGYTMSANQPDVPILNQCMREYSDSDRLSSESSAVVAYKAPPCTPVSDMELMTIKVSYREDIIKFDLPLSSSKADLMENVIMRWCMLRDKAFVIKYLDDSRELILLATDKDLEECMVRTRSMGNKVIRMLIQLKEDVQDVT